VTVASAERSPLGASGREAPASGGPCIGILGPYTSRNLGDTAIQMAVIGNLRRRLPDAQLLGISWDPQDALRCHGIPAVHLAEGNAEGPQASEPTSLAGKALGRCASLSGWNRVRRAWRVSKIVRTLDLLAISGSGQLDDFWGGPWAHPYALLLWSLLARVHGVPVAVVGIGLDDLSTRLGRWFAFAAMRLAHRGYVRDRATLAALQDSGIGSAFRAGPDPAFGVREHLPNLASAAVERSDYMVCPISRKAWLRESNSGYETYVEALTVACTSLIRGGARLRLAYSQVRDDRPVTHAIHAEILTRVGEAADVSVIETSTVPAFVAAASGASVVIASRLHALILAASIGTPIVAVAYGRKVKQLMRELGMEQFSIDLSPIDHRALEETARRAWNERNRTRAQLDSIVQEYQSSLSTEYEALVDLVRARLPRHETELDPDHVLRE
jgi:polysaccharide pyruvyl transferase WcaK-like protein